MAADATSRAFVLGVAMTVACVAPFGAAHAQRVTLRIRPPLGDTLRMRLEQRFELGGEMSAEMRIWTHAVVARRNGSMTDLTSVTDSVTVSPPSAAMLRPLRDAQRALEGRTVYMRISEDGAMSVVDNDAGPSGFGAALPSVLPSHPVAVGESWTRDLRVPLSTTGSATGDVNTAIRLDSLSEDGGMAYLSFHGEMSHQHGSEVPGSSRGQTTGTVDGTMQVDRRLSWITDSRMIMSLTSEVQGVGKSAQKMRMRVTQSLKALVGY